MCPPLLVAYTAGEVVGLNASLKYLQDARRGEVRDLRISKQTNAYLYCN